MTPPMASLPVRLGRIGYVNVLPIYHALETGRVPHRFSISDGVPAELNRAMRDGELDMSACSSIEYARRPQEYYLIPNLAIASRGPVMSVLLMSQVPIRELDEQPLLVTAQTHTSVALLRLLLKRQVGARPVLVGGDVRSAVDSDRPPLAFLAIGDEAMRLRGRQDYPYRWDLGQAWTDLTGLPFVFGVWVVGRAAVARLGAALGQDVLTLLAAKRWGQQHLLDMAHLAAGRTGWEPADMLTYFRGLTYDLGDWELQGLVRFYQWLAEAGEIPAVPDLAFFGLRQKAR